MRVDSSARIYEIASSLLSTAIVHYMERNTETVLRFKPMGERFPRLPRPSISRTVSLDCVYLTGKLTIPPLVRVAIGPMALVVGQRHCFRRTDHRPVWATAPVILFALVEVLADTLDIPE